VLEKSDKKPFEQDPHTPVQVILNAINPIEAEAGYFQRLQDVDADEAITLN